MYIKFISNHICRPKLYYKKIMTKRFCHQNYVSPVKDNSSPKLCFYDERESVTKIGFGGKTWFVTKNIFFVMNRSRPKKRMLRRNMFVAKTLFWDEKVLLPKVYFVTKYFVVKIDFSDASQKRYKQVF